MANQHTTDTTHAASPVLCGGVHGDEAGGDEGVSWVTCAWVDTMANQHTTDTTHAASPVLYGGVHGDEAGGDEGVSWVSDDTGPCTARGGARRRAAIDKRPTQDEVPLYYSHATLFSPLPSGACNANEDGLLHWVVQLGRRWMGQDSPACSHPSSYKRDVSPYRSEVASLIAAIDVIPGLTQGPLNMNEKNLLYHVVMTSFIADPAPINQLYLTDFWGTQNTTAPCPTVKTLAKWLLACQTQCMMGRDRIPSDKTKTGIITALKRLNDNQWASKQGCPYRS